MAQVEFSNSGANCVEIAETRSGKVAVENSRNPDDGALTFSPDEWQTFVAKVQDSMTPHSLGAGAEPARRVVCYAITRMITAAKSTEQAAEVRKNH